MSEAQRFVLVKGYLAGSVKILRVVDDKPKTYTAQEWDRGWRGDDGAWSRHESRIMKDDVLAETETLDAALALEDAAKAEWAQHQAAVSRAHAAYIDAQTAQRNAWASVFERR